MEPYSISQENHTKKYILASFIVMLILAFDQILKYWVKTHMYLGQEHHILGNWFILHFTENNGMAFGLQLGGDNGKLFLSVFRIIAVIGILYYLIYQIKHKAKTGLIVCISLVLAGAVGNIIDSVFYGVWFNDNYNEYLDDGTLKWKEHAPYFFGRVVDMLYFPVIEGRYPDWFPVWGGESFLFFRPVFNIADTSISVGVFSIILLQKWLFNAEDSLDGANDETKSEEFNTMDQQERNENTQFTDEENPSSEL